MPLHGLNRIQYCLADVEELKEYIQINQNDLTSSLRYSLLKSIKGQKIKNRIENLFIALWSAKDWMSKDILSKKNKVSEQSFVDSIHRNTNANLVAYLANATKHGTVDKGKNIYMVEKPKFGRVILIMVNQSVPGKFKPIYKCTGDDILSFDIEKVSMTVNGETYLNFDKITLDVEIVSDGGNLIRMANAAIEEYCQFIDGEYNKWK
ncbi:hypothetical protein LBMAG53_15700 [Planctomycetota bacterium]|nr:hypothetical protein LBMAG53_15700 [Planctomycetota bacterium]